jgi:hypothetical protein
MTAFKPAAVWGVSEITARDQTRTSAGFYDTCRPTVDSFLTLG